MDVEECPYCGSDNLSKKKNEVVCEKCGTAVRGNHISSEQEPFYSYEDVVEKAKHSHPPSAKTKTQRRNLSLANSHIGNLIHRFHLPHFIKQEAMDNFKQVMDKKRIRKDRIAEISAALVYLVSRKCRIPLPLKRIYKESEAKKEKINSAYWDIRELLEIEVRPQSVEGLATYIAKEANLGPETISLLRRKARNLREIDQVGKNPYGVAGALAYKAAKEKDEDVTKEEIAKTASVTDTTLKNILKTI